MVVNRVASNHDFYSYIIINIVGNTAFKVDNSPLKLRPATN